MPDAKRVSTKSQKPGKHSPAHSPAAPAAQSRQETTRRSETRLKRSDTKFADLLFVNILHDKPHRNFSSVLHAIRKGYDAKVLRAASSFFEVSDARIRQIANVPATTASRLESKNAPIDAAASERIYRMSVVTRMAIDVFENESAAISWMREPHHMFDGAAPLDLMDTEPGAQAVKQVLNAIATGGAA